MGELGVSGEGRVLGFAAWVSVVARVSVVAGRRGPLAALTRWPTCVLPQVQLHLIEMIKAKKSGAGHTMYKVIRRVLIAPIVVEDTYCLEVVGTELRGKGGRNAQGEAEGRGRHARMHFPLARLTSTPRAVTRTIRLTRLLPPASFPTPP